MRRYLYMLLNLSVMAAVLWIVGCDVSAQCPNGFLFEGGRCVCPLGAVPQNGQCVAPPDHTIHPDGDTSDGDADGDDPDGDTDENIDGDDTPDGDADGNPDGDTDENPDGDTDGDADGETFVPPVFAPITAGTFTMGSPDTETGHTISEVEHQVSLTVDFDMMIHEVTQGDFETLMGYNPSDYATCGESCPVGQVSWHEALVFANLLSDFEGLDDCFDCFGEAPNFTCQLLPQYTRPQDCPGYRLPTEAEWEFAARANSQTALPNGDLSVTGCNEDAALADIAWYCFNSENTMHPVGMKGANAFGLYDMAGNVYEWVWDREGAYSAEAVSDPVGPETGSNRILRGGGWNFGAEYCRSAARSDTGATARAYSTGFRLVRSRTER